MSKRVTVAMRDDFDGEGAPGAASWRKGDRFEGVIRDGRFFRMFRGGGNWSVPVVEVEVVSGTAKPRLPKITKKQIKEIAAAMPEHMARVRQDEKDRRCLSGKYAPTPGVCRACGGEVVGRVRFRHTDRIGGPPPPAYVSHWACEGCGLMYEKAPHRRSHHDRTERSETAATNPSRSRPRRRHPATPATTRPPAIPTSTAIQTTEAIDMACSGCGRELTEEPNVICPRVTHWQAWVEVVRERAVLDAMRAVLECGPMRCFSPTDQKLVRDELLGTAWRVLDVVPGLRARDDMHEIIGAAIRYGERPAAERRCRPDINVGRCGTHHFPLIDGKCKNAPKEAA